MADNVALVEQAYEAFGRGDIAAVVGMCSDDLEWHEAEHSTYWSGEVLRGPQQVVDRVLRPIAEDNTDFRIQLDRIVGCGDTVLVQGRYLGTWRASGRAYDIQMAHVWDLADGLLVRFQQYTDTQAWTELKG